MSSSKARRLCPDLIFTDCRFDVYKTVSAQIHEIFHRYTDIIEPISLDEAFLDVTENFAGMTYAVDIAREIKQSIRRELSLVASAGVSYNKFLAKIASDYRKPDGLCVIPPERAPDFVAKMPVESFWGVGPVTAAKMHSLGIYTGADLRNFSVSELRLHFGKAGSQYYNFARGIDNRPVESVRIRKSVGCERTTDADITTLDAARALVDELCIDLERRLAGKSFDGTTLTLKLRFGDFTTISRSTPLADTPLTADALAEAFRAILDKAFEARRSIRLIGVAVVNNRPDTHPDSRQLLLDI